MSEMNELPKSPSVPGCKVLIELCKALNLPVGLKVARIIIDCDVRGILTSYVKRYVREDEVSALVEVLSGGDAVVKYIGESKVEIDQAAMAIVVDGERVN